MLVELRCGRQVGQVVDLPPLSARAMVADGRAVWPEGSPFYVAASAPAVASAQVHAREDRSLPRTKRRAER